MPVAMEKSGTGPALAGGKKSRGRMPTKTTINFAEVGVKRMNWLAAVPGIVLIVAAAVLFGKFLVADRLQAVWDAQNETARVRSQVEEGYKRIDSFGEVNVIYAHYTFSGMTEEELVRVDRVAVLEMLSRRVIPWTPLDSWTLTGNQLALSIDGNTLEEINAAVQRILSDELVDYCTVNTATTNGVNSFNEEIPERVTANIVIYLKNPEEASAE